MTFHIPYQFFDDASALPEDERMLLERAMQATEGAYAPYSQFYVGCAVQLDGGEVITGNNQENKAYPSGICAERTALYYAGAQGKSAQVRKIAVRGRSGRVEVKEPVTPCGACRQVMLETESLAGCDILVLMQGESGRILRVQGVAKSLLPFAFTVDF